MARRLLEGFRPARPARGALSVGPLIDGPLPVVRPTVYSRCLHRAAQRAGGLRALSRLLHVPREDLLRYMTGVEQPPRPVFLAAVDIVVASEPVPVSRRQPGRADPAL